MIQLVILFIFVVFVIIIIQLYKKYIKIKNVVDEEQNKKYSKVREAVGSNNERIKDMKKQAKEIVNDEKADASSLDSRVSANKQQIASNRDIIVDRNFETINSVFKYDSGLVIGGTAGHMRVGDNNIRLNVQNPTQVRVCDADNKCTNIITRKMVQDTWPTQISSGPGVLTTPSPVVVSNDVDGNVDGNLEFNNDTKIISVNINLQGHDITPDTIVGTDLSGKAESVYPLSGMDITSGGYTGQIFEFDDIPQNTQVILTDIKGVEYKYNLNLDSTGNVDSIDYDPS